MSERPKCEIPDCSVKADDYKCFRGEPTGFEQFKQINLIIGKNNTGKSALLDLAELVCHANAPRVRVKSPDLYSKTTSPIQISNKISENYNPGINFGTEAEQCHEVIWQFKYLAKKQIEIDLLRPKLPSNTVQQLNKMLASHQGRLTEPTAYHLLSYHRKYTPIFDLPLGNRHLFRLEADRDLVPNNPDGNFNVRSKGQDVISLLHKYGTDGQVLPLSLLERIEHGLSEILGDEIDLKKIQTATIRDKVWDLHLFEREKKPLPISASGSGLKTILLVLSFLHLLPQESKAELEKCVFCLEELENNLHPSAQRRLFKYLLDFIRDKGCMLFLTTHSNVAIDIFSKCSDEEAQILHVTHDGSRASVDTIEPQTLGHVLDDLGYQASDILQSNYLVWVEGPSDRIYIKHALEKDHKLEEGVDYSIMFYGGRLLSHLDFDGTPQWDEDAVTELIDLAKINRNSAVVLDSDKTKEDDELNVTKERIIAAFTDGENDKCFAWVTQGREIENYIEETAFKTAVDAVHTDANWDLIKFGPYDQRTIRKAAKSKKAYIDKVKVARELCNSGNLVFNMDWDEQIKKLAGKIRAANGM